MAGSVLYFWLVIVFVYQSKQIISKSELNPHMTIHLHMIINNYYNDNIQKEIQPLFWINYCSMYTKHNGISLSLHVIIVRIINIPIGVVDCIRMGHTIQLL